MTLPADQLKYVVNADSTVQEAWSQIEINRHRSVLVLDGKKVVGALSDGDIRKIILAGGLLSTPVGQAMTVNFIRLRKEEKSKAKAVFEKHDIFLIPVVDDQMNLLEVIPR